MGSVALLISFIETLIAIPITFIAPSLVFRIILIIFAFLGIFAFYLNRSRHIVMAGIICVLGTKLSIWGDDPH